MDQSPSLEAASYERLWAPPATLFPGGSVKISVKDPWNHKGAHNQILIGWPNLTGALGGDIISEIVFGIWWSENRCLDG